MKSNRRNVHILTTELYIQGDIEPEGAIGIWLNKTAPPMLPIYYCTVTALDQSNTVQTFKNDKITLALNTILTLGVGHGYNMGVTQVLASQIQAIVYLQRFLVKGLIQLPPNNSAHNLFDGTERDFIASTQAFLHSTLPVNASIPQTFPLLFINKQHVVFYYTIQN